MTEVPTGLLWGIVVVGYLMASTLYYKGYLVLSGIGLVAQALLLLSLLGEWNL